MDPLTRRDFARGAGLATALSYSRILGANDRVGMGYIGLGNRGDQVHDAFLEHGDAETVAVCDLRDDTFYALIWMERDGQMMSMDARPSDALALALRLDCPIFVEEDVIKTSKMSSASAERGSNEELRKWLENLSDEDLGRYKM